MPTPMQVNDERWARQERQRRIDEAVRAWRDLFGIHVVGCAQQTDEQVVWWLQEFGHGNRIQSEYRRILARETGHGG